VVAPVVVPTLSIADLVVTEVSGENAVLTITLSSVATETVTVNYGTANGTATNNSGNFSLTANSNNDYSSTSGTATILAGQTTVTVAVPIYNDPLFEGNETFSVVLSNASASATISNATATVTITDNEIVNSTAISEVGANSFVSGTGITNGIYDFITTGGGNSKPLDGILYSGWDLGNNSTLTYTFYNQQMDGSGANALDGGNPTYAWTSAQQEATTEALQSWANVSNVDFQYVTPADAGNYYTSGADISMFLIGDGFGANVYGLVGEFPTSYSGSSFNSTVQGLYANTFTTGNGDVFINQTLDFTDSDIEVGGNGWNTLVHELGHALGFYHSWNPQNSEPSTSTTYGWTNGGSGTISDTNSMLYSNMSYNAGLWTAGTQANSSSAGNTIPNSYGATWDAPDYASSQQYPVTDGQASGPMAFDMMSSSYVYGANTSYNAGNTTYTLSTSTVLETIWDGGGTDTLDGSGISGENIILDLTLMPENPSSQWFNGANITSTSNTLIGGAFLTANDVTSFQAVTIENAIAGSGDDILIGNAAANELTGGAGSDTLTGGSGNDIFVFNSLSGSDTISDWNTANDTLQFSSAVFDASGVSNVTIGSAINADDLLTGVSITNASSSGQTFLFDTDSATLYYDADGVAGGAVVVADLGSSITIDQTDIVMIA
jgi:serralysin